MYVENHWHTTKKIFNLVHNYSIAEEELGIVSEIKGHHGCVN